VAKEQKCSRGGGGTPEHLQKDRERDDWSEQRGRTQDETATGGSHGGLAWWWLDARRDSGGWMRDETAMAGGSRGGLEFWARWKSRREEEIATTAAQQWQWQWQHERRWQWQHGARVVGVDGTCRESPEFAERNGSWRARGRRGSVFEP